MSSIPLPLSLLNYTRFAISGCRSSGRFVSTFQRQCLSIEVASVNLLSRPVVQLYPGSENLVSERRFGNWRRLVVLRKYGGFGGIEFDDDEEEEEERGRSVDLLVKFMQNVFRKISKKGRKAVRSVLPVSIPTELVRFSVDGVTMLGFLWLVKAFLEVVCTVGSVVFLSILLIRGIWYGIPYIKESAANRMDILTDERLRSSIRLAM